MKDLKIRARRGFTLIELVVVIAILGILAGIAIPRFLDATATARGAKIVADLRTIDSAIVIYNAKTGYFPSATTKLTAASDQTAADRAGAAGYVLLASWPVPQTGVARFPSNPTQDCTVSTAAYTLTDAGDRAQIKSTTADQLAAGGSFNAKTL